jgi:hypothetical protein
MNVTNFADGEAYGEALHGVSHYVSQVRVVHVLALLLLALGADYAWMLYMRWRMVSRLVVSL